MENLKWIQKIFRISNTFPLTGPQFEKRSTLKSDLLDKFYCIIVYHIRYYATSTHKYPQVPILCD